MKVNLKKMKISKISITYCNKHISNKYSYRCDSFVIDIVQYLTDETLSVEIKKCLNIKQTQQLFMESEILISHGSSFSFIPGLTKGKKYITNFPGTPVYGSHLEKHVHWTIFRGNMLKSGKHWETFNYRKHLGLPE